MSAAPTPTTPWLVAYYRRRLADPTLSAQDRAAFKRALAYAEARLVARAA